MPILADSMSDSHTEVAATATDSDTSTLVTAPSLSGRVSRLRDQFGATDHVVAAAPPAAREELGESGGRPAGDLTVPDAVPDAGAPSLRDLGFELAGLIDDHAAPTVWLALDPLLADGDLATAFRFVHVLDGRLRTAGGRLVCTLAAERYTEETVLTLEPLFDRRVAATGAD